MITKPYSTEQARVIQESIRNEERLRKWQRKKHHYQVNVMINKVRALMPKIQAI